MLKEKYCYLTYHDGGLDPLPLSEIVRLRHELENSLWSARLSTGLLGLPSCPAGNRGPKGTNEIVLASGATGLRFLIKSGFIPCPTCHPENITGFYQAAAETITSTYGLSDPANFANKNILTFDARRVHWEVFLPKIMATPDRLYVPSDLPETELIILRERFEAIGFELPPVGFYDRNAPGHFREYNIPNTFG